MRSPSKAVISSVLTFRVESTVHASTTTSGSGQNANCRSAVLPGRLLGSGPQVAPWLAEATARSKVPPSGDTGHCVVHVDAHSSLVPPGFEGAPEAPIVPLCGSRGPACVTARVGAPSSRGPAGFFHGR
jgi:hypothetical protein